jgi:hypothetical protein
MIFKIRDQGLAVVVIEHDMRLTPAKRCWLTRTSARSISARIRDKAAVGCPVLAWELACEYAGKCSAGQEQAG